MGFSFKAMWNYNCPKCRQGKIFTEPFLLSKPLEMPYSCEYCGQRTEPEPGFYYGAMFLSYITSSLILLPLILLLIFYFNWSEGAAMGFLIIICIFSYLRFLRGSRSLWLHMMVKHDPIVEEKVKKNIQKKSKTK